jgi:hypothetical protein
MLFWIYRVKKKETLYERRAGKRAFFILGSRGGGWWGENLDGKNVVKRQVGGKIRKRLKTRQK